MSEHIGAIRTLLRKRVHADFAEIQRELEHLEAEVAELRTHRCCDCCTHRPVSITLTTSQKGIHMGSYTAGTEVTVVATVKAEDNGQQVQIADALSWSADSGTITAGPNSTDADGNVVMTATLVNAPIGTTTVTATTSNGIPMTDAIPFTDPAATVPVSISLTDSATPAAAAPSA